MFTAGIQAERRIVRRHRCPGSQSRLHKARSARSRAARAARCATSARSWSAGAETSDSAARSSLHDAGVHSAKASPGFGAEKIGIGDRQVVSCDRQVEIVFKREVNGVFQGQIEFSIADRPIEARRVREHRLRYLLGRIWTERAMRSWHLEFGGSAHLCMGECGDDNESCQPNKIMSERSSHPFTATEFGSVEGVAVAPTSQPSRICRVRVPYAALASEWVTCTIVV